MRTLLRITPYSAICAAGPQSSQLIANVSISFQFLARHVKIVAIGPTDVVDMNPKRVLGLIWAIFVYYEVLSIPDVKSVSDLKEKILAWARRRTSRYPHTRT